MNYTPKFYKDETSFERYLERERTTQVIESISKLCPCSALDIGPGLRPYFFYLNWSKYTIIEPNKEFINYCPNSIIAINSTLEDSNLNEKFDAIIISSVLHLVKDCDLFLEKLKPLCHKNTLIHINVPNTYSLHRLIGFEMGLIEDLSDKSLKDIEFNHKTNFSEFSLHALLMRHNFKIEKYKTYMIKPFANEQMSMVVTPGLAKGLQNLTKYLPRYGCEIMVEAKYEME